MKNTSGIDTRRTKSSAATDASNEISKIGTTAVGITAGIIGCWAVTSMITGITNSGGPINLMTSLFKAITG
jgi:hypothetical protein